MKHFFYIFLSSLLLTLSQGYALTSEELKAGLIPENDSAISTTDRNGNALSGGEDILDRLLAFARDSIFGLLFLVALLVFLYIGVKLIIARGNPEEFKKALQSFIYAAVGLFIIAFAWALVRLVAGLNI